MMIEQPCIFVTGVWKSGNHLAYSALNSLGVSGPFNGLSAHLLFGKHRFAKRILRSPKGAGDAIQIGLETDALISRTYISKQVEKLRGKILGGHAAYSEELEGVLVQNRAAIICIRRDPRDILVSFADWIQSRPDFYLHGLFRDLNRNDRIRLLLRGGDAKDFTLRPFIEVVDRARGWLECEQALQISFEELIGSKGGGDDEAQASAMERIHRHINSSAPLDLEKAHEIYGGTLTFNHGKKQRWRDLDDEELDLEIAETLKPSIMQWGYQL